MNKWLLICFAAMLGIFSHCNTASADNNQSANADSYQCLPCGLDCDRKIYKTKGECPSCHMELVKTTAVNFTTIQPAAICQYIKDHPNIILLDVRTKNEFEGKADPNFGALKNAINIPIQQLAERLPELEQYKAREIIVYCSHSHRSPRASYLLTQNGFSKVINMAGGMSELRDKGCVK